jgi:hypothetical protein
MKYFKLSLKALAVGIILFSSQMAGVERPGPDPGELWTYITEDSPYTEWGFWDDHQGIQPGNGPHGPFHRVFVNETLLNAADVPVPYGSILVKESFDQNQQPTNITVMYKVKDYNPDAGDWFWARYSLDGTPGPAGKVKACIGCHGVKAANDYITTHEIKRLP